MAKTGKEAGNAAAFSNMAEEAVKSYEQILRTGLKLQQEVAEWWGNSLQQAVPPPDWGKCFAEYTSSASKIIPAAQKRLEEVMHLLEQNNRHCIELIKQATEAAQTSRLAESQAKWIEFWKSSAAVARSNAEALTEANAKMVNACIDFMEESGRTTRTSAKAA